MRLLVAAAAAAAAAALPLSADPLSAQTAGFVVLLGRDTVALERVTRSAGRVEGDLFTLFPRTRRAHDVVTLDARGHVSHFELKNDPALDTPPAPSTSIVMDRRDTLAIIIRTQTTAQGARTDTARVRVRAGAVPFVSLSTGLLEQLTMQTARAGTDSVAIETLVSGQREATPNYVARRGPDSVAVDYFGSPFYLRVDPNKRTGQGGTEYHPAQDLVCLDLKSEPLPGVVEQFTIAVIDLGKAGELRFDWDRVRWILPFSPRAP